MTRARAQLLGLVGLLLGACTTVPPATSIPATSMPAPTMAPCGPADVALVAGATGAAAGSMVLTIEAHLVAAAPCRIAVWPAVVIVDGAGGTIVSAPAVAGDAALESDREFHVFWSSNCDGLPAGPYTLKVQLGTGAPSGLRLPAEFGPSGCNGAPMQVGIEPAWDD